MGFKEYFKEYWGAPFIIVFIVLLMIAAVVLAFGLGFLADRLAEIAFYFLVVGVVLQLVMMIREGESGHSREE